MAILGNTALGAVAEASVWEDRAQAQSARAAAPQYAALPALPLPPLIHHAAENPLPARLRSSVHLPSLTHLPLAFGSVRGVSLPATRPTKIVLHIQDIHMNVEAQTNISGALREMAESSGVTLVGVEGAFAPLRLSSLGAEADSTALKVVADTLLSASEIQGPLHAALMKPGVRFVGVDERDAYVRNGKAYRAADARKTAVARALSESRDALDRRKRDLLNPSLATFDAVAESYAAGRMTMAAYAGHLLPFLPGRERSMLARFVDAGKLEARLDFPKVERERARLLAALSPALTPASAEALLQRAMQFRAGQLSFADFYTDLRRFCDEAHVSLARFPEMDAYIRYALAADSLDSEALFADVRSAEAAAYRSLTRSPAETALIDLARLHRLREKLADFALSSDDWSDYDRLSSASADKLTTLLKPFEDFYREAEVRDDAMARKMLAAMDGRDESLSVLVTGGFHSRGIEKRLNRAGMGVVTFTPRVTKVESDSGSAYLTVFLREKTPLEDLFRQQRLFFAPQVETPELAGKLAALSTAEQVLNGGLPESDAPRRFAALTRGWFGELRATFNLKRLSSRRIAARIAAGNRQVNLDWRVEGDNARAFEWTPAHVYFAGALSGVTAALVTVLLAPSLSGHLILLISGTVAVWGAVIAGLLYARQRGGGPGGWNPALAGDAVWTPAALGWLGAPALAASGPINVFAATPPGSGGSGGRRRAASSTPPAAPRVDVVPGLTPEQLAVVNWYRTVFFPEIDRLIRASQPGRRLSQTDFAALLGRLQATPIGSPLTVPAWLQHEESLSYEDAHRALESSLLDDVLLPEGIICEVVGGRPLIGRARKFRDIMIKGLPTAIYAYVPEPGDERVTPERRSSVGRKSVFLSVDFDAEVNGLFGDLPDRYLAARRTWATARHFDREAVAMRVMAFQARHTDFWAQAIRLARRFGGLEYHIFKRPLTLTHLNAADNAIVSTAVSLESLLSTAVEDDEGALYLLETLVSSYHRVEESDYSTMVSIVTEHLVRELDPRRANAHMAMGDLVASLGEREVLDAVRKVAQNFLDTFFWTDSEKLRILAAGALPETPPSSARVMEWFSEHVFRPLQALHRERGAKGLMQRGETLDFFYRHIKSGRYADRVTLQTQGFPEGGIPVEVLVDVINEAVSTQLLLPAGIGMLIRQPSAPRVSAVKGALLLDTHTGGPVVQYSLGRDDRLLASAGGLYRGNDAPAPVGETFTLQGAAGVVMTKHRQRNLLARLGSNSRYSRAREEWMKLRPDLDYNADENEQWRAGETAAMQNFFFKLNPWAPYAWLITQGYVFVPGSPFADRGAPDGVHPHLWPIQLQAALTVIAFHPFGAMEWLDKFAGNIGEANDHLFQWAKDHIWILMVEELFDRTERRSLLESLSNPAADQDHAEAQRAVIDRVLGTPIDTLIAVTQAAARTVLTNYFWTASERAEMLRTGALPERRHELHALPPRAPVVRPLDTSNRLDALFEESRGLFQDVAPPQRGLMSPPAQTVFSPAMKAVLNGWLADVLTRLPAGVGVGIELDPAVPFARASAEYRHATDEVVFRFSPDTVRQTPVDAAARLIGLMQPFLADLGHEMWAKTGPIYRELFTAGARVIQDLQLGVQPRVALPALADHQAAWNQSITNMGRGLVHFLQAHAEDPDKTFFVSMLSWRIMNVFFFAPRGAMVAFNYGSSGGRWYSGGVGRIVLAAGTVPLASRPREVRYVRMENPDILPKESLDNDALVIPIVTDNSRISVDESGFAEPARRVLAKWPTAHPASVLLLISGLTAFGGEDLIDELIKEGSLRTVTVDGKHLDLPVFGNAPAALVPGEGKPDDMARAFAPAAAPLTYVLEGARWEKTPPPGATPPVGAINFGNEKWLSSRFLALLKAWAPEIIARLPAGVDLAFLPEEEARARSKRARGAFSTEDNTLTVYLPSSYAGRATDAELADAVESIMAALVSQAEKIQPRRLLLYDAWLARAEREFSRVFESLYGIPALPPPVGDVTSSVELPAWNIAIGMFGTAFRDSWAKEPVPYAFAWSMAGGWVARHFLAQRGFIVDVVADAAGTRRLSLSAAPLPALTFDEATGALVARLAPAVTADRTGVGGGTDGSSSTRLLPEVVRPLVQEIWEYTDGDTTRWEVAPSELAILKDVPEYPVTGEEALTVFREDSGLQGLRDKKPANTVVARLAGAETMKPEAIATKQGLSSPDVADGWMASWISEMLGLLGGALSRIGEALGGYVGAPSPGVVEEFFRSSPGLKGVRERKILPDDLGPLIGELGFHPEKIATARGVSRDLADKWLQDLIRDLYRESHGNVVRWEAMLPTYKVPPARAKERAKEADGYFRDSRALADLRVFRPGADDMAAYVRDYRFSPVAMAEHRRVPRDTAAGWLWTLLQPVYVAEPNLTRWPARLVALGYTPDQAESACAFFLMDRTLARERLRRPGDEDMTALIERFGLKPADIATARGVRASDAQEWLEQFLFEGPLRGRPRAMAAAFGNVGEAGVAQWLESPDHPDLEERARFHRERPLGDRELSAILQPAGGGLPDLHEAARVYEVPFDVLLAWIHQPAYADVLRDIRRQNPGPEVIRDWIYGFMGNVDAIAEENLRPADLIREWMTESDKALAKVLRSISQANPDLRTLLLLLQDKDLTDDDRQEVYLWMESHHPDLLTREDDVRALRREIPTLFGSRVEPAYSVVETAYEILDVQIMDEAVEAGDVVDSANEVISYTARVRVDPTKHPHLNFKRFRVRGADGSDVALVAEGKGDPNVFVARGTITLRDRTRNALHAVRLFAVDTGSHWGQVVRGRQFPLTIRYTGVGALTRAQTVTYLQFLRVHMAALRLESYRQRLFRLRDTVENILMADFAAGQDAGLNSVNGVVRLTREQLRARMSQMKSRLKGTNKDLFPALEAHIDETYLGDTPGALPALGQPDERLLEPEAFQALIPYVDAVRVSLDLQQNMGALAAGNLPKTKKPRSFSLAAMILKMLRRTKAFQGTILNIPYGPEAMITVAAVGAQTRKRSTLFVLGDKVMMDRRVALADLDVPIQIVGAGDAALLEPGSSFSARMAEAYKARGKEEKQLERPIRVLDLTFGSLDDRLAVLTAAEDTGLPNLIFATPDFVRHLRAVRAGQKGGKAAWRAVGLLVVDDGHLLASKKRGNLRAVLRDFAGRPDVMRVALMRPSFSNMASMLDVVNFLDPGVLRAVTPRRGRQKALDPDQRGDQASAHELVAQVLVSIEPGRFFAEPVPAVSLRNLPYDLLHEQMSELFLFLVNFFRIWHLRKLFTWESKVIPILNGAKGGHSPKREALRDFLTETLKLWRKNRATNPRKILIVVRRERDAAALTELLSDAGAVRYGGSEPVRVDGKITKFRVDRATGEYPMHIVKPEVPTRGTAEDRLEPIPDEDGEFLPEINFNLLRFRHDPRVAVMVTTSGQLTTGGTPRMPLTHVVFYDPPINISKEDLAYLQRYPYPGISQIDIIRMASRINEHWKPGQALRQALLRHIFFRATPDTQRLHAVDATSAFRDGVLLLGHPDHPQADKIVDLINAELRARSQTNRDAEADEADGEVDAEEDDEAEEEEITPAAAESVETAPPLNPGEQMGVFGAVSETISTIGLIVSGAEPLVHARDVTAESLRRVAFDGTFAELVGVLVSGDITDDDRVDPGEMIVRRTTDREPGVLVRFLRAKGVVAELSRPKITDDPLALLVDGKPLESFLAETDSYRDLFLAVAQALRATVRQEDGATLLGNWRAFFYLLRNADGSVEDKARYLRTVHSLYISHRKIIPNGNIPKADQPTRSLYFSQQMVTSDDPEWLKGLLTYLYQRHFSPDVIPFKVMAERMSRELHRVWPHGDLAHLEDQDRVIYSDGFVDWLKELYESLETHVKSSRARAAPQALIFRFWEPVLAWLMDKPRSPLLRRAALGLLMAGEEMIFAVLPTVVAVVAAEHVGFHWMTARAIAAGALIVASGVFGALHDRRIFFNGRSVTVGGRLTWPERFRLSLRGMLYRAPLIVTLFLPGNLVPAGLAAAVVIHLIDGLIIKPWRLHRDQRRIDGLLTTTTRALQEPLTPDEQEWYRLLNDMPMDLRMHMLGSSLGEMVDGKFSRVVRDVRAASPSLGLRRSVAEVEDLIEDYFDESVAADGDLLVPARMANKADILREMGRLAPGRKMFLWIPEEERDAFERWLNPLGNWESKIVLLSDPDGVSSSEKEFVVTAYSLGRAVGRAVKAGMNKERMALGLFKGVTIGEDVATWPPLREILVRRLLSEEFLPAITVINWIRMGELARAIAGQA